MWQQPNIYIGEKKSGHPEVTAYSHTARAATGCDARASRFPATTTENHVRGL